MESGSKSRHRSPLLYKYCSQINLASSFTSLASAKWITTPHQKTSFKYSTHFALLATVGPSRRSSLICYNVSVPIFDELDDLRLSTHLDRLCAAHFQSEITVLSQSAQTGSAKLNSLVFVCQRGIPDLSVFFSSDFLEEKKAEARMVLQCPNRVNSLRTSAGVLLAGCENGAISVLDIEKGKESAHFKYHREAVTDLIWLKNAEEEEGIFISSSLDAALYIWDVRKATPIHKIDPKQGRVFALERMRENVFISGGETGVVKFWDQRTMLSYSFKERGSPVLRLSKLSAGEQIKFLSGAADGLIRLWREKTEFIHWGHKSAVQDVGMEGSSGLFMSIEKENPTLMLWQPASSVMQ